MGAGPSSSSGYSSSGYSRGYTFEKFKTEADREYKQLLTESKRIPQPAQYNYSQTSPDKIRINNLKNQLQNKVLNVKTVLDTKSSDIMPRPNILDVSSILDNFQRLADSLSTEGRYHSSTSRTYGGFKKGVRGSRKARKTRRHRR